jgi:hypothetical protein
VTKGKLYKSRPARWAAVRLAAFMMGVAASGGPVGLIRNFRDPSVRQQLKDNRCAEKRDKELSKRICEATDPAVQAMFVKILIAIDEEKLPKPSGYTLQAAIGYAREQVNDARNDCLTAAQERNIFERTFRRMSFMRMCIGTGIAFAAYIEEHPEPVAAFIRPSGVTTQQLHQTLSIISNSLKAERLS